MSNPDSVGVKVVMKSRNLFVIFFLSISFFFEKSGYQKYHSHLTAQFRKFRIYEHVFVLFKVRSGFPKRHFELTFLSLDLVAQRETIGDS